MKNFNKRQHFREVVEDKLKAKEKILKEIKSNNDKFTLNQNALTDTLTGKQLNVGVQCFLFSGDIHR